MEKIQSRIAIYLFLLFFILFSCKENSQERTELGNSNIWVRLDSISINCYASGKEPAAMPFINFHLDFDNRSLNDYTLKLRRFDLDLDTLTSLGVYNFDTIPLFQSGRYTENYIEDADYAKLLRKKISKITIQLGTIQFIDLYNNTSYKKFPTWKPFFQDLAENLQIGLYINNSIYWINPPKKDRKTLYLKDTDSGGLEIHP